MERVRIDRWLWAARFFKTRGTATEAILGGHVQVGGQRVKPAKEIRVGDTLGIRRGELRWTVVVTGVADRRGPATVAATPLRVLPLPAALRQVIDETLDYVIELSEKRSQEVKDSWPEVHVRFFSVIQACVADADEVLRALGRPPASTA